MHGVLTNCTACQVYAYLGACAQAICVSYSSDFVFLVEPVTALSNHKFIIFLSRTKVKSGCPATVRKYPSLSVLSRHWLLPPSLQLPSAKTSLSTVKRTALLGLSMTCQIKENDPVGATCSFAEPKQRPYIVETLHSYTLPM